MDAEQYSSGQGTHYLTDTDAVMSAFYTYCQRAGPRLCAFYSSSPSQIESRLEALLADLKIQPIIVPASSSNNRPELITYSKIRKVIASALYRPLVLFPLLAEALSALESGNGLPSLTLSPQLQDQLPLCDSSAKPDPTPDIPEVEGSADASRAILCTDQAPFEGGVDAFGKYLEECETASKAAGATMASMRLGCVEWRVRAKWRFAGPFKTNISTPILFVANTADNITPLKSAVINAKGFPGSMVLRQNSYGVRLLLLQVRCVRCTDLSSIRVFPCRQNARQRRSGHIFRMARCRRKERYVKVTWFPSSRGTTLASSQMTLEKMPNLIML